MESNLTNPQKSSNQSVKEKTQSTKGRRKKTPNTTRGLLYKETTVVNLPVSDVEVEYIPPTMQQYATIFEILTEVGGDIIFSKQEKESLTKKQKLASVGNKFNELVQKDELLETLAIIFLDHRAKQYLYELYLECFPGLDIGRLKEQVYVEMFGIVLNDFNKNIANLV